MKRFEEQTNSIVAYSLLLLIYLYFCVTFGLENFMNFKIFNLRSFIIFLRTKFGYIDMEKIY